MKRYRKESSDMFEDDEGYWVRYEDAMTEINRLKERILDLEMPRRQFVNIDKENS